MTKASTSSNNTKNVLYCAFCGSSQNEVNKLIAGPEVLICDGCVEICMDILEKNNTEPSNE